MLQASVVVAAHAEEGESNFHTYTNVHDIADVSMDLSHLWGLACRIIPISPSFFPWLSQRAAR